MNLSEDLEFVARCRAANGLPSIPEGFDEPTLDGYTEDEWFSHCSQRLPSSRTPINRTHFERQWGLMVAIRRREQFGPSLHLDGTETVMGKTRAEWDAEGGRSGVPRVAADDVQWEYMVWTFGD